MSITSNNKRALLFLNLIVFLDNLGVALVVSLLPFIAQELEVPNTSYGLVLSVYGTLQIIGGPFLGKLSDVSRKKTLLLSLVMTAVSYTLLGLAWNIGSLLVSRVIVGLFKSTFSICNAYASELSPTHQRTRVLGDLRFYVSVAFIVGPAVGGFLGVRLAAFCSVCLYVVAVALVYVFLPNLDHSSLPKKRGGAKRSMSVFGDIQTLRSNGLLGIALIATTTTFSNLLFTQTYSLYLRDSLRLGASWTGYLSSYNSLLAAFSSTYLLTFLRGLRLSEDKLLAYGSAVAAASLILMVLMGNSSPAVVTIFVVGPVISSFTVVKVAAISKVTVAVQRDGGNAMGIGFVLSILDSLAGITRAAAPLIAGALTDYLSPNAPLVVAAAASLIVLVL